MRSADIPLERKGEGAYSEWALIKFLPEELAAEQLSVHTDITV